MLTSIRLLTYPYRLSRYICTVETSSNESLFYFAYQNIIPIFAVQTISTIVDKIVNCFKSFRVPEMELYFFYYICNEKLHFRPKIQLRQKALTRPIKNVSAFFY